MPGGDDRHPGWTFSNVLKSLLKSVPAYRHGAHELGPGSSLSLEVSGEALQRDTVFGCSWYLFSPPYAVALLQSPQITIWGLLSEWQDCF